MNAHNRYSYCLNSPLKFTDPSGYCLSITESVCNREYEFTFDNTLNDRMHWLHSGGGGSFYPSGGGYTNWVAGGTAEGFTTSDPATIAAIMEQLEGKNPGALFDAIWTYTTLNPDGSHSANPYGDHVVIDIFGDTYNRIILSLLKGETGDPSGQGGVVVDNSWQATKHYLFGDGSPARIGPNTTNSLLNSPQFLKAHRMIINGQTKPSGNFPVDMTKRVFHIGRTNVSYSIAPGGNSVTYKLYDGDGFWDPDFIDEKYLGLSSPYFRPDKMGPNLERFGGTPYYYIPTIITFPF